MHPIRTLMSGILDYAGLFPPAKLDMAPTVRNYAAYRAGRDSWMLSRLIVPAARIAEFVQHASPVWDLQSSKTPWRLSVLTAAAGDASLEKDLDVILAFNDEWGGHAIIDAIELKTGSPQHIDSALDIIPESLTPFFELPLAGDARGLVAALAGTDAGAKARTGGVTPDLFPPAADLARFIRACALAHVPFKATAGLHHPFTHPSGSVPGVKEFGFVNVFLGAAMAMKGLVSEQELTQLLADEARSDFESDADGLSWCDRTVPARDIARCRKSFALSYGSCSFVEPLEDLRRLKLLD